MKSIFLGAAAFAAAAGLGAALLDAQPAHATQERVGEYLRRHHVKPDHGRRLHGRPCRHCGDAYRIIRVEPDTGTKVYYAPVRHAPLGDQVRLQSGNWEYCEATCEYTFRKNGPDFWLSQSKSGIYPHYLRFEFPLD
jgi:hypothetical protein